MQVTKNALLWMKKAELLQILGKKEEALEVLEKAIKENVKPTHIIDDFLEKFIENMLEENIKKIEK